MPSTKGLTSEQANVLLDIYEQALVVVTCFRQFEAEFRCRQAKAKRTDREKMEANPEGEYHAALKTLLELCNEALEEGVAQPRIAEVVRHYTNATVIEHLDHIIASGG